MRDQIKAFFTGRRPVQDTSIAAAESIAPNKAKIEQMVIDELAKGAATCFELAERMGLPYSSIQPRTSELKAKLRIVDSGLRHKGENGKKSIVWKLP